MRLARLGRVRARLWHGAHGTHLVCARLQLDGPLGAGHGRRRGRRGLRHARASGRGRSHRRRRGRGVAARRCRRLGGRGLLRGDLRRLLRGLRGCGTPPPRAAGTPAGALARGPLTPPVPCSLGCARCQCCRVRVVRQVPGSQWGLQACTANDGRAPAPVRTQASRPGQTLHLPEPAQAQTAVLGRGARAPAAAGAARLGLQQPAAGRGGVVRPPARRRGWRRVAGVAIPVGVRGRSRRGASAGVPGGGGAAGILADELRRRRHGRDDGRRRRRVDVLRACTRRGPQAESAPLRSGRPNPAPCRPTLGASRTRQALRGPGHRAARRRGAHRTSGSGMHGHAGAR